MKLQIKTLKLQEMVNKAVKGSSNNKMIPITGLMAISLTDHVLTLTTTDGTNTLKVIEEKVEGENFNTVVATEIFSKLVSKTTSENITLTLTEKGLQFTGNGKYVIDLPLDEEGVPLKKFPDYKFDTNVEAYQVLLSNLKVALATNKVAVAKTLETPVLTGYYFGNQIITTDRYIVCCNNIQVFEQDVLLPAEFMNLVSVLDTEKITVQHNDNKILLTTPNVVLFGVQLDDIDIYPADAVNSLANQEFSSMCKLPKQALMNVIDRLSLFVDAYDHNGIYLTFTNEGVNFASKKSNSTELIRYQGSENFVPYTCCANIDMLKAQLSAQDGEVVELWYGHAGAIKFTSGKLIQIISLIEDDRMTNGESGT